jgi:hypothetical protein
MITNPPPEGGMKILLLLVSFFIPIAGIIIGIIYYQKPDEANKAFGKQALIVSVASIALSFICAICYFIFIFGAIATSEFSLIGLVSALV